MDHEPTLLSYLVPRLTSRGEDTATDALAFILNKSEACRRALASLLSNEDFSLQPLCRFETQVTYEDGSRPDMVGYDREGSPRLLVESKFWAALLQGQAGRYFRQLDETKPCVLLFIAPGARIERLWAEIRRQLQAGPDPVQLESVEARDLMRGAGVEGSDNRVMLISWDLLLENLAAAVPDHSQVASDIQQLRGLVQREDIGAFTPIQDEELSPSLARRIRSFNTLIIDAIDRGVREGWASGPRRRSPQIWGNGCSFRFVAVSGEPVHCDFWLGVNTWRWARTGDTPLWLHPSSPTGHVRSRLLSEGHSLNAHQDRDGLVVPVYLKTGVEYHDVLDDVVDQLSKIANIVVNQ